MADKNNVKIIRKKTKPKTPKKKPRAKAKRSTRAKQKTTFKRRLLKFLLVVGMWSAIFVTLLVLFYAHDLPSTEGLNQKGKVPTIKVLSADGILLHTVKGERGSNLEYSQFPSALIDAVIATEDRRFFDHFGLDVIGLGRAVYTNYRAGYVRQGGSTITQQLAKVAFLSPERTLKRKVQELLLALWLENNYSKEQIITMYLNRVYLGAGAFGVDSAARTYFNKPASELTINESALMAGLLKAPSKYSPFSNPDLAQKRMHQVLANMVDAGYLSTVEAIGKVALLQPKKQKSLNKARYFVDWVVSQVPDYIGVADDALVVKTTLNVSHQLKAEKVMRDALSQKPYQGAMVVLGKQGEVLAMVGGKSYMKSQYNRATQAQRQPGSAFKLFVYLAALEKGYNITDNLTDSPVQMGDWAPRNYGKTYRGQVTLEDAFAASINTVAVRLSEKIGRSTVIEMARRLGITSVLNDHPSIALGASETNVLEITGAYAHMANGGKAVEPYGIVEIKTAGGQVLYRQKPVTTHPRVVTEKAAADMHKMLEKVVNSGTGKRAAFNHSSAGKTGTSQESRDAWFVGYSPHLITGVWVGNDNNSPMKKVTGGSLPADIFKRFMQAAHKSLARKDFGYKKPRPSKVYNKQKEEVFWDKFSSP